MLTFIQIIDDKLINNNNLKFLDWSNDVKKKEMNYFILLEKLIISTASVISIPDQQIMVLLVPH